MIINSIRVMLVATGIVATAASADCDSGSDWITTDTTTATATVSSDGTTLQLIGADGTPWGDTTVINVDAEHQRILELTMNATDVANGWYMTAFNVRKAKSDGSGWDSFGNDPAADGDILADFRYEGVNSAFTSENMSLPQVGSAVIYDRNCHQRDVAFQVCAQNNSSQQTLCSDPVLSDKGGTGGIN